jgi:hypothetical protein
VSNSADVIAFDWRAVAGWLGWALTALLSALGARTWNQVQSLKDELKTSEAKLQAHLIARTENLVKREEFEHAIRATDAEREKKHGENITNFRRLDDRLTGESERRHLESMSIEKRLGEVLAKIAELKPSPPRRQEGPERRQGY